ncbi:MAG: ABC transporter permease [Deltaproteobacteria bacterium]|nr:MAG: ABC transporter permease [Deltaproteobacteria bacterium]
MSRRTLGRITAREMAAFFATPAAYIFLGTFLAVTLFVFFWVETFFSRNIADVRPLFEWMPVLLIFLCSALTMRSWSEEQRAGTMESLLTAPVRPVVLILGKFFACVTLVAVALALTLPLVATVSLIGPLDPGPVLGGYLASLCLAATYISIGLFVSSRTNSQIVSLISATLACALLFLLGSPTLTGFFGNQAGEILKLLGSGSRFEAITRGVIDLRDIIYYLSLTACFLTLNVYGIERQRWAGNPTSTHHRTWGWLVILIVANFLAVNFWLAPVGTLRADLTSGQHYSISETTRGYLDRLQEPLLIRGYFSAQTHPLLAPLVPQLRDLMKEYQVVGHGRVRVEFIDPQQNPELEAEAGEKYGIRPVPFQTASRYQTAVTNSYFDILVKYGDAYEVLGFKDLIEVKGQGDTRVDVDLRNPEYDLTRAIKKVLYSYQGGGNLFANITTPVVFHGYFSADERLPAELVELKQALETVLSELAKKAEGSFSHEFVDPDADPTTAARLEQEYGMQPMVAGLLSPELFWFYMTLESGDQVVQVGLPADLSAAALTQAIEAGLKRFSKGFLKTVGLAVPAFTPPMPQFGMPAQGKSFQRLQRMLAEEHAVKAVDLAKGQVDPEADILVVVSPGNMEEKQIFAVDQFLMQGGTVVLAASPFDVNFGGQLQMTQVGGELGDWLAGHGIALEEEMVLDPQNASFPVPVQRQVGAFTVQETHLVNYPYFIDIRSDGMDRNSGLLGGIDQVSMTWASPVDIDQEKNAGRKVTTLLRSSPDSWVSDALDLQPDFQRYPDQGFAQNGEIASRPVAVLVEGSFTSAFQGKPSPLVQEDKAKDDPAKQGQQPQQAEDEEQTTTIGRVLEKSPESARIILLASNTFLADTSLDLASGAGGSRYHNPVQLIANCIDWSLEDRDLMMIRGRSHFARTLFPMAQGSRMFLEYLNYGLALAGLALVWFLRTILAKRSVQRQQALLEGGRA